MQRGLLVTPDFFTDHFPDKVVAVLSELAMKYSSASSGNGMTKHYSFSDGALGDGTSEIASQAQAGGSNVDNLSAPSASPRSANLMEDLVKEQRGDTNRWDDTNRDR
jgi:hypothetical protein